MFLEHHARWLLILHAILGAAVVASSTHLAVWMRGYVRGTFTRQRAIRRFAAISVVLFGLTFAVGNVIYPTYKARVRMQYLDHPSAPAEAQRLAAGVQAEAERRYGDKDAATSPQPAPATDADRVVTGLTSRIAKWFDVKEHWAALGFMLSSVCAVLTRVWNPGRERGQVIATTMFAFAVLAAATTWLAALIGLVTSSVRAVG